MGGVADAATATIRQPSAAATRSQWRLTLLRFRRDRWSVAAATVFAVILLISFFGGAIASAALGHNGTDLYPYAANINRKPVGPLTWVPDTHVAYGYGEDGDLAPAPKNAPRTLFIFGADGILGHDEFLRVLDGGKASLEVGLGAVIVALLIGLPFGAIAGFFGGITDWLVSQFTETVMAFPLIFFLVFASVKLDQYLTPIGWGQVFPRGVFAEALLIGVFTSFYPTRLVRAALIPLRNAEFVDAARMVGASSWRILRKHLLPYLVPTLIIWGAIATATNILLEVGLSFVGAGVQPETPTWGSLLSTTWGTIYQPQSYNPQNVTVWQTVFPTLFILLTVVSLNQLAEGIRRATDPGGGR
jgi:ABC-type dipeptide/oligopeptide/nickel transport system permease subunit